MVELGHQLEAPAARHVQLRQDLRRALGAIPDARLPGAGRLAWLCAIPLLLLATCVAPPLAGQDDELSAEEQREQLAAERFLELLLRRPATGTAMERVSSGLRPPLGVCVSKGAARTEGLRSRSAPLLRPATREPSAETAKALL